METNRRPLTYLREWEFWAAFAVLVGTYVVRFEAFPLVGEETRYARVTVEMFERGDWIVPREMGDPFNSRPPLLFWLMALPAWLVGDVNVFAIRCASIAGVVLTGLLTYAYSRTWLTRTGSLMAVLFWATFPELLIANRKAEAEALFTFGISACLIGWHWAYTRGWSVTALWLLGYILAAVATMVKGPQAPLYFGAITWIFLAMRRDWAKLFNRGHLLGIIAYAALLGMWIVPYCWAEGIDGFLKLWLNDSVNRFRDRTVLVFFKHLASFPAEIIGCTMPWSIFLFAYCGRQFRAVPDSLSGHRIFLTLAAVVGFVPCWLTPGGETRYFQPLYPCLAILMARAVEHIQASTAMFATWRRMWRCLAAAPVALCAALVGLAVAYGCGATIRSETMRAWIQPAGSLAILSILAIAAAFSIWRAGAAPAFAGRAVLAYAVFAGSFATSAWVDSIRARAVPLESQIASLKESLPPGQPAYFLTYVHHRFACFHSPPLHRLEVADLDRLKPGDCVCVTAFAREKPTIPGDFQIVGVLSMDRFRDRTPDQVVVVFQAVAHQSVATVVSAD